MNSTSVLRFGAVVVLTATLAVLVPAQQVGQTRTIRELNEVPADSLAKMETLQSAASTRLDDTPYVITNDTVRVTGVVLVRPRLLTYTLARYNIFIQDTTTGEVFAGLNVLTNDTSSTAQQTGITALDSGDVVTVTGRALEFGSQPNSLTEMYIYSTSAPAFTSPVLIEAGASIPRPAPRELTVDSFALGTTPRISSGEKYEGMYIVVRNVTVNSVDLSSGRFTFVDSAGNQMGIYDGSGYYTLRGHKISGSRYAPPPVGTKLLYVRGVILPQPRTGTAGEYTIMPLYPGPNELTGSSYPGDIKIDKFAPSITLLKKTPGVPKSTDSVTISFKAVDLNNAGGPVDSAFIFYRNATSGPYTKVKLTLAGGDSLYRSKIPPYANSSYVSYFAAAYAGGGFGMFPDSTVPYFYVIRDAGLTIYDVQWTPYVNGQGPFTGDTVQVSGIVSADTSDIREISGGRPRIWMAQEAGNWRGIAMYGSSAGVGLDTLRRGDSVTVTAVSLETNSRSVLNVLSMTLNSRDNTVPAVTQIGISGGGSVSYELSNPPVNGNPTFEQWEGVLVRAVNAYVVNRNADNPLEGSGSNFGEFMISSNNYTNAFSRFGLRVDDNGTHRYYADTSASYTAKPSDAILLPIGLKIDTLKAIFDYSFSFYKLEPRKDDDFGNFTTSVFMEDAVPGTYALSQNFPNPFNPATSIRYTIPMSAHVSLRVFNILGQEVASLVNQDMAAGSYLVQFEASRLTTGVYFYQLRAGDFSSVKKMVLVK